MLFKSHKLLQSIVTTGFFLHFHGLQATPDSSTWTGDESSFMRNYLNWTSNVPYDRIAIFDGNANNAPLSNAEGGLEVEQLSFTADTDISITSSLSTRGDIGVLVLPNVTATFEVYEYQPLYFPPAQLFINNGSAGTGGGIVNYNLESYGQLYAYSGSTEETTVNITMTGGNNYFEIFGAGSNLFDNIRSNQSTDEIHILTGSDLTIRGASINIINGQITGEGSLTKTGPGTLILNSNSNTFAGNTFVLEGALQINGIVPGDVNVYNSATISGIGLITGNLIIHQGTVSPGNSIGTLNVGSFSPSSASIFACEVSSSGAADQIIATDTISLNGTLNILPTDLSFESAQTYQILQANVGITGTFSHVKSSEVSLISLDYTDKEVSLTYVPLSAVGLHGNAAAAANCFITQPLSDINAINAKLLDLSFVQMQKAFNHMQPAQFSGQTWTQLSNALLVSSGYNHYLKNISFQQTCKDSYQSHVWVDTFGQWQKQHLKNDQIDYNDWTSGISLGTDSSYKKLRFGGAASYTYSQVHWEESAGKSHINSYYTGLYGGWTNNMGYIIFSTLGAYNQYHSSRHLSIHDLHTNARASHHGWQFLSGLEGGTNFTAKHIQIGPFIKVDYVYLWQQKYHESGANSLNLHIKSRQDQLIQSQAGLTFSKQYVCNPNHSGTLIPRLELSYINQTPLAKSDYYASFQNSSCEFPISGQNFERNLGAVNASLTYLAVQKRLSLSIEYDGQFGIRYSNQSARLLFDIKY